MKYIKKFDFILEEFKYGDYVIAKEKSAIVEDLNEFLSTHVGILENESKLDRKKNI